MPRKPTDYCYSEEVVKQEAPIPEVAIPSVAAIPEVQVEEAPAWSREVLPPAAFTVQSI